MRTFLVVVLGAVLGLATANAQNAADRLSINTHQQAAYKHDIELLAEWVTRDGAHRTIPASDSVIRHSKGRRAGSKSVPGAALS
jgi:hypothetical protein